MLESCRGEGSDTLLRTFELHTVDEVTQLHVARRSRAGGLLACPAVEAPAEFSLSLRPCLTADRAVLLPMLAIGTLCLIVRRLDKAHWAGKTCVAARSAEQLSPPAGPQQPDCTCRHLGQHTVTDLQHKWPTPHAKQFAAEWILHDTTLSCCVFLDRSVSGLAPHRCLSWHNML